MLICESCKRACSEEEEVQKKSSEYGYYSAGCPACGGELLDAVQCRNCDEWFAKEDGEVFGGLCLDCVNALSEPDIMLGYIDESAGDKHEFIEFCFEELSSDILAGIVFEWYDAKRKQGSKYIDFFEKMLLMYCTDDCAHYSAYLLRQSAARRESG